MPDAILHKTFDCKMNSVDEDSGDFDLYAAVFENRDRQDEIIAPGAFANLAEFVSDGCGLVNHGMSALPVAWIESAVQDAKGLRVRGRFHSTPEAQACRTVVVERMRARKGVKCSIGYRVLDDAMERADGATIRRLKSVNVYEFSFVNLPANPQAGVNSAKSIEADMPDEPRSSFVDSIKEWLGLATKAGRSVSKANHEALSKFADAIGEHGKGAGEHVKGLTGFVKSLEDHGAMCSKLSDEMKAFLKPHSPEGDGDEAEPDADDKPEAKSAADEATLLRLRLRSRA